MRVLPPRAPLARSRRVMWWTPVSILFVSLPLLVPRHSLSVLCLFVLRCCCCCCCLPRENSFVEKRGSRRDLKAFLKHRTGEYLSIDTYFFLSNLRLQQRGISWVRGLWEILVRSTSEINLSQGASERLILELQKRINAGNGV